MLTLDESDEITNPYSKRAKAALSCFRRCRSKLLTTGTSTRSNISEFAPQLELLYNNSVNMVSWCRCVYSYNKDSDQITSTPNRYYGCPIPACKRGVPRSGGGFKRAILTATPPAPLRCSRRGNPPRSRRGSRRWRSR